MMASLGAGVAVAFAAEILVDELDVFDIAAAGRRRDALRLPEEGVHLPELLLLPFVERMVVALRALHLQAEEDLRGHRRGLRGVFLQLADQEVRRAVEIFLRPASVLPGGRDQLIDHLVVGLFAGERIAQILLHALAADQRAPLQAAVAADQDVRPDRRPIAGIVFGVRVVVQDLVDELGLLVRSLCWSGIRGAR